MNRSILIRVTAMIAIVASAVLTSCEKYVDYTVDYDFTAVYFSYQTPLRTLVARDDSNELRFKTGVALSGVRSNTIDRDVVVELEPDLLASISGGSKLKLLPKECYTTSIDGTNRFTIPKGSSIGAFDIVIDKSKFTQLDGATEKTYALPYRILDAQVDSILVGNAEMLKPAMDYQVIVVKYVNENSGHFYANGTTAIVKTSGNEDIEAYGDAYDTVKSITKSLTTLSTDENGKVLMQLSSLGNEAESTMNVSLDSAYNVVLSSVAGKAVITDLGSSYDAEKRVYTLNYRYKMGGVTCEIHETLRQRQDPEKDLRWEEWK